MAEAPLHIALCGFGAFGRLHAAAWRHVTDVTLTLVDPDPAARARASEAGFAPERIAPDLAQVLDAIDIVDVVAPPAFHLPLARAALEAGKPVMVEKPAVRTLGEAETLLALARDHDGFVQVGMILRCHPLTLQAKALLDDGAIGRLLSIEGEFCGWKRMRADSSLVENDGVHFLDLQRFLAGGPIEGVDARGVARLGGSRYDDIEIRTALTGGATGHVRLGLVSGGDAEDPFVPGAVTRKSLRLIGDQGVIEIDFNRNRLFHGRVAYVESAGGWTPEPGPLQWHASVGTTPVGLIGDTMRSFLSALKGESAPVCTVEEGALEMARVLSAIETALARPVQPLPPLPGLEKLKPLEAS